jgi:hypothetical protein
VPNLSLPALRISRGSETPVAAAMPKAPVLRADRGQPARTTVAPDRYHRPAGPRTQMSFPSARLLAGAGIPVAFLLPDVIPVAFPRLVRALGRLLAGAGIPVAFP